MVETGGLTRRFGDLTALDGPDLPVAEPSIIGFLGLNVARTTTAMKLLVGPARPTAGRDQLLGLAVSRRSTDVRACRVPGPGPALL